MLIIQAIDVISTALGYFKAPQNISEVALTLSEDLDELVIEVQEAFKREYQPTIGTDAVINVPTNTLEELLDHLALSCGSCKEDKPAKIGFNHLKMKTVEEFLLTPDGYYQDTSELLLKTYQVLIYTRDTLKVIDLTSVNGGYNKEMLELLLATVNPIIREVIKTYTGGSIEK